MQNLNQQTTEWTDEQSSPTCAKAHATLNNPTEQTEADGPKQHPYCDLPEEIKLLWENNFCFVFNGYLG